MKGVIEWKSIMLSYISTLSMMNWLDLLFLFIGSNIIFNDCDFLNMGRSITSR